MTATLELDGVSKVYDDAQGTERAVDDVSATIEAGEFAVLVGPSGCGKTTALRMIAGLETVTEGRILLDGREVQHLAPSQRDVAMVFQNYALYPRMTGRQNMAYGLKHAAGMGRAEREERVTETAEMLDITDVLDHRPDELSGGQKQRVALGRAIVREPSVFLLDEPLSNLDAKLRAEMRRELQRIHDELGVTTVYVTHDQKEAMTMADRIAVMRDGRFQQVDDPERAYERPANQFVGEFLGSPAMNTIRAEATRSDGDTTVRFDGVTVGPVPVRETTSATAVTIGMRPESLTITTRGAGTFDARVVDVEYQGSGNFVFLEAAGTDVTARVAPSVRPEPGETVGVDVDATDLYVFDAETGASLRD